MQFQTFHWSATYSDECCCTVSTAQWAVEFIRAHAIQQSLVQLHTIKIFGLLQLKDCCALALDRASTNKKAKDIRNEDYDIQPFTAYCISHGLSTCGKKGKTTVGKFAMQHMTGMVKFSLCKSKTAFHVFFCEAAKKESGFRWCQKFEQCEQVNRITLIGLRDEWASICVSKK